MVSSKYVHHYYYIHWRKAINGALRSAAKWPPPFSPKFLNKKVQKTVSFFAFLAPCPRLNFPSFCSELDNGIINLVTYPLGRGTGGPLRGNGASIKGTQKVNCLKAPDD